MNHPEEFIKTTPNCIIKWILKERQHLAEASRNCVVQALGLVKSYWPQAKIGVLDDGTCSTCDHDQFVKFVEEAEPVADQIVKLIDQ